MLVCYSYSFICFMFLSFISISLLSFLCKIALNTTICLWSTSTCFISVANIRLCHMRWWLQLVEVLWWKQFCFVCSLRLSQGSSCVESWKSQSSDLIMKKFATATDLLLLLLLLLLQWCIMPSTRLVFAVVKVYSVVITSALFHVDDSVSCYTTGCGYKGYSRINLWLAGSKKKGQK